MKLNEIRKKLKSKFKYETLLTVIKRDGKIVCRYNIGSPRNKDIHLDIFNAFVRRTLHVDTIPNIYQGYMGCYSNWWVEAIIEDPWWADPDEEYHKEKWVK